MRDEIKAALSRPNITIGDRNKFQQQIARDEDINLKTRDDAVAIIKENFVADIRSGADQFLLSYTEDIESGNEMRKTYRSKNFSTEYRKRRFRRRDWRGR